MLSPKQQAVVASDSGELKSPSSARNPNEKVTRTDINFDNFFDQLVLPVISDAKAIEAIRAVLADPKLRANKFRGIAIEADPKQLERAEGLLKELEINKKLALTPENLDLIRGFYTVAFRPVGVPLMSEDNQAQLRSNIEGAKLSPKMADEWERFKNFGFNGRTTARGFVEGTLILFAMSARCAGPRQ